MAGGSTTYTRNMRIAAQLLFIFVICLWLPNSFAFVVHRSVSTPFRETKKWSLQAIKLVYKWKVLPSGSLTGITDEGIITTSQLKRPESASPNAVVVTESGSQYKLVGKPVDSKDAYVSSPSTEETTITNTKNGTSAAASFALFAGFGIFLLVLIQKSGILSTIAESESFVMVRFIALLVYCVGVLVATVQLIDDALKFSKK
jgi:hypothetical protein